MAKIYEKPVVSIDTGLSEGVYAASGASQGTLNVTYYVFGTVGEQMVVKDWRRLTGRI